MRIHGSLRLGSGLRARLGFAAAVVVAFSLAACGSMNVVSEGADADLMLRGNDPVAYFTAGRPQPGRSDIKAEHRGLTYRFANGENRRQFITNPEQYVPQFGGFCAYGVSINKLLPIDITTAQVRDGKLYFNLNPAVRVKFDADFAGNVAKATANWPGLVAKSLN